MSKKIKMSGYSKPEGVTLYYLHKICIKELSKYKNGKLLEISPGELRFWRQIKELNKFEMYGCDIERNDDSIKYCNLNTDDLPYSDAFFDYVICCEVIEHIHNPWKLIAEIKRVLKPSGRLIISTPNISKMYDRIYYLLKGFFPGFQYEKYNHAMQHINPINIKELLLILHKCGFVVNGIKYNTMKKYQRLFPKGWFGYSVAVFAVRGEGFYCQ